MATRLRVPSTPRQTLPRERLFDVLDRGVRERVVLLSAPAGAGKTVLLASWIGARELPGPTVWLALDREHNDASRLLADLLSALHRAEVFPPGGTLQQLSPPTRGGIERFLPLLVNGLAELQSPVVLVLDDLHELSSQPACETVGFLVRHAPEQCRLVLASRADPDLGIERLRVGGALTELRSCDLAFNREETMELCRQLELDLREADVQALWTHTEGWAAALGLAALSLRTHPDPARFVAEFAGTDRAIADYLLAEVLARLPVQRREFMLRTSLVEEVSPELADALTGSHGGAATLAGLEQAGAFVQRSDPQGDWYRYHPLFAELLRAHLHHTHGEEEPLLRRRAARWYTRSLHAARLAGHTGDAERLARGLTHLAAAGGLDPRLARALRSFALSSLGAVRLWGAGSDHHGAIAALEQALALAEDGGHEHIALNCLAQLAVAEILAGRPSRAAELGAQAIALAERRGCSESPPAACAYLAAATAAYQRGELTSAELLAEAAARAAQTAEAPVRIAVSILQALVLSAAGPQSATRAAAKLRGVRAAMDVCSAQPDFLQLALAQAESRVLLAAGESARAATALAGARAQMPDCAELDIDEAALALHEGRPEDAREPVAHALARAAYPATQIEAWLMRALVDRADADPRGASEALEQALALAEGEPLHDAFRAHGQAARELLEEQAASGTAHPALLETLLDGLGAGPAPPAVLAEPLTEREQRILRYLPTMLSNAEIGAETFVSLNTVKTHLRSIYRKLDAGGRAEAVQKARELQLLPAGIKRPRVAPRPPR